MKSVYSAVRTGSLNKAACASSLKGYVVERSVNRRFDIVSVVAITAPDNHITDDSRNVFSLVSQPPEAAANPIKFLSNLKRLTTKRRDKHCYSVTRKLSSCDRALPSICGLFNDDSSNSDDIRRAMTGGRMNHEWERMWKETVTACYKISSQ